MDVMNRPSLEQGSLRKVLEYQTSELLGQPPRKSREAGRARKPIYFNTDLHQFVTGSLQHGFLRDPQREA